MDNGQNLPRAEEWRPVVGFRKWYEVSSFGRVRRIGASKGARAHLVLRGSVGNRGYRVVALFAGSRKRFGRNGKRLLIHRLVAAAFIGPCPPGQVVNHKDADKLNNRPENLEYVSRKENNRHAHRLGISPYGSRIGNSKLTELQVAEIRNLLGTMPLRKIARRYDVSPSVVCDIRYGRLWRHVR